MDEERGLRSAGWRAAAVRGSGGGPGEAAGEHAGLRTSTSGHRPSHRNGPAHRTGNKIRAKVSGLPGYFLNKFGSMPSHFEYTQRRN